MDKKNLVIASGMALALFSVPASAETEFSFGRIYPSWFSYSYAQIRYVDMDEGFSGLSAGLSFDIRPNWNLLGEFLSADASRSGHDLEYRVATIGAGYHYQLKNFEKSDLMFHVSFMQGKAEWLARIVGGGIEGDETDTGIRVGARLRYEPQRNLEVNADLSYNSLFDNDLTFTPGVVYRFGSGFAVEGSFEFGDRDMLAVGIRYYIR